MTETGVKTSQSFALSRRGLLVSMAAAAVCGMAADPVYAQRFRRRMRRMRRRALRRLHRRGNGVPDRARRAIRQGEIRPLRDVLASVRRRSDAEVLDVDLHQRGGTWVYALRVLTPNGRVRDVFVDGRTLEVLNFTDAGRGDGVPLPPDLSPPRLPRRHGPPDGPGPDRVPPGNVPPPVRRPP